jgi:pSer/pThr/pTyr-binding forkhead associated (FHA) protein
MSIWLVMRATDGNERSFPVQKPCTVIGRETTCDVRIPIPTVSQKHCQITLDDGELRLSDLNSDHGTYHNGSRVQNARLSHEDTLTIGPVTFKVRVDDLGGNGHEVVIVRQADSSAANTNPFEG